MFPHSLPTPQTGETAGKIFLWESRVDKIAAFRAKDYGGMVNVDCKLEFK